MDRCRPALTIVSRDKKLARGVPVGWPIPDVALHVWRPKSLAEATDFPAQTAGEARLVGGATHQTHRSVALRCIHLTRPEVAVLVDKEPRS
jgi:hypothetical protein